MMRLSEQDITVLRELGKRYMAYASLPVQEEKRQLWLLHNSRRSVRPMVLIDQMPWNELDVDGFLQCRVEEPYFRSMEWRLRMEIYKWEHLPADMVLNPYILLPRMISDSGCGVQPKTEFLRSDPQNWTASQRYTNIFEEPEDVEKIKDPVITVDLEAEKEIWETAQYVFDGIGEVRFQGKILHLGIWDFVAQCMGVENCYVDLLERPEMIHDIMDRLTTGMIARIEQYNRLGLYDVTGHYCHCSHTFSEDLPGADCDENHPVTQDGWAFGMAQLFTSVSPAITAEFEVPYMQRLFPYFGAIYYGCCDRLDDRLDIVDRMPNIRKISCSPWSDRDRFAAQLPKKYIMSNKPNPALLAGTSFHEDAVREDLRHTIRAAKEHHVCLEMILKDISTVNYDPRRLWRWAEIAMEEARAAE